MSGQETEKPWLTLPIPNVETAAYLCAVLNVPQHYYSEGMGDRIIEDFFIGIVGGRKHFDVLKDSEKIRDSAIWGILNTALRRADAAWDSKNPPWGKPQVPKSIDGYEVSCSSSGVKVGCVGVPLAELELMVIECKELADNED